MRFEHLIEINNPAQPLVTPFAREALWAGLMLRVHEPQRFPLGPDRCEITPGAELNALRRRLHFGALQMGDTVAWESGRALRFQPDARDEVTPVNLTITLEEPAAGVLLLRFVYESAAPLSAEEAFYNDYRQSAWLENDRDMVRTLRQWLAEGALTGQ